MIVCLVIKGVTLHLKKHGLTTMHVRDVNASCWFLALSKLSLMLNTYYFMVSYYHAEALSSDSNSLHL